MKKELLMKWTALCVLALLIALPVSAQQEKCWSKEYQFLERGTSTTIGYLQVKKFCYCVDGFYGYMDFRTRSTQAPLPAYAYADATNSSDWSVKEHDTSVRVYTVRCSATGKWNNTDQDYYYLQESNMVGIPEMPETTVQETLGETVETMETASDTTNSQEEMPAMPSIYTTTTETIPPASGWPMPSMASIVVILLILAGLGAVLLMIAAAAAYLYLRNKKKKAVIQVETAEKEKAAYDVYEQQKKKVQEVKDECIKTLDDYSTYKIPLSDAKQRMNENGDRLATEKEALKKIADNLKIPYDPAQDRPDIMAWAIQKLKAGEYAEILVKDLSELGLNPGVVEEAEKSVKR